MEQVMDLLENIIVRAKSFDSISNVRFVREYGNHMAETPINSFLAVVSVTGSSLDKRFIGGFVSSNLKGEQFGADVEICVYSPLSENGSGLSEITSEIMQALKKADVEKIIENISISPINFDSNLNSISRTISFRMEFCLCEEV